MKTQHFTVLFQNAKEIIQLLQDEAVTQFSSFPEAFGILKPVPCDTLTSAFVTDGTALFYHPASVCEEFLHSATHLRLMYLHTHIHCLCLHLEKPQDADGTLWDAACDLSAAAVAAHLVPEKYEGQEIPDLIHPYSALSLLQKDTKLYKKACSFHLDSHEFWPHRTEKPEVPEGSCSGPSIVPQHSQNISHDFFRQFRELLPKLEQEISSGSGKRNLSSGKEVQDACLERRGDMDYRQFLRRFTVAREEAVLDPCSFDYIPYTFGLAHYHNMPFIEPLEYCEVNKLDEFAIAIDTSASCSGNIVRRFLEETWTLLRQRENFFSRMRLHILQCDSMIQDHKIITSVEEWEENLSQIKILGHGNTDFRPVFEYLDDLIKKNEIHHLRGLLYFTDGDGIFPRFRPTYDTAFVFLNHRLEKQKIPDWAIRLNLNLPEETI